MKWSDVRLSYKLYLGFGVVLAAAAVVGLAGFAYLLQLSGRSAAIERASSLSRTMVERMVDHLKWSEGLAEVFYDPSVKHVTVQLDEHNCKLGTWLYSKNLIDLVDGEAREVPLLEAILQPHAALHQSAARISELVERGDQQSMAEAKRIYVQDTRAALADVQKALWALRDNFDAEATAEVHATEGFLITAATTMIILILLGTAISFTAAFLIARSISRPLSELTHLAQGVVEGDTSLTVTVQGRDEVGTLAVAFQRLIDYLKEMAGIAERVAAGDLTVAVVPRTEKDSLGTAFSSMVHNLSDMIRQLSENARELVSAATEIATASEQMSKGAREQCDQINQVSTAVEQMSMTILESSHSAAEATGAACTASEIATGGGQIVSDTIRGMQKISEVVRQSAESIARLAKSANQIGEITGVINDIADQTNLLALNAAIEAARAGEQGRGFAVVADEVRKLAERTGKATGEITQMIHGIQEGTGNAVNNMEAGVREVNEGKALADKAGSSLGEILHMTQRVTEMVRQMASATEQQSSAAEQISKNVDHITSVTKETAIGAEQSAAAAEELNRQAEGLQLMVGRFRLIGGNMALLHIAKQDHRSYVARLRKAVGNPSDAAAWKEVDHHSCRFGRWYYTEGTADFRAISQFEQVEEPHIRVHRFANEAVRAKLAGNDANAQRLFAEVETASRHTIDAIERLQQTMTESSRV